MYFQGRVSGSGQLHYSPKVGQHSPRGQMMGLKPLLVLAASETQGDLDLPLLCFGEMRRSSTIGSRSSLETSSGYFIFGKNQKGDNHACLPHKTLSGSQAFTLPS